MAWIAEPLTFFAVLAMGLVLCLFLFISLKRENSHLRQVLENDRRLTVGKMEEFRSSMTRLQGVLEQAHSEVKNQAATPSETSDVRSVNIAKRGLALRMHRHGETPEQIASTLNIPRSEVDLLLKVHQAVIGQPQ